MLLLLCRKISHFFACILRLGFAWLSYDGVLSSIFHYPAQWTCRFFMLKELCLTSMSIYRRPGKESLTTHLMLTHISLHLWTNTLNKEWMFHGVCMIGKKDCSSILKASPSNTKECLLIFGLQQTKRPAQKPFKSFPSPKIWVRVAMKNIGWPILRWAKVLRGSSYSAVL